MSATYDYLFKLLLIGDSAVGKTSLILRYTEDAYSPSFISTIGIDFKVRTLLLEGKRIKLQIWDTAGQERFRSITTVYFRGAMGIMLVYDVTKEHTFKGMSAWIRSIREQASGDVQLLLVGNKCDMGEQRVVAHERAEKMAIDNGLKFIEVSAKARINIEQAFLMLVRDIKAHIECHSHSHIDRNASQALNIFRLRESRAKGGRLSGWLSRCRNFF